MSDGAASGEKLGLAFAQRLGVQDDGVDALSALRALPAERITGDLNMMTLVVAGAAALYPGPMVDGRVVAETPEALYRGGRQRAIPLIVGATTADLSLEFGSDKDARFAKFGDAEAEARRLYDPTGTTPMDGINRAIGSDQNMVEPARFVARAMAARGVPVFEYRFGYVADEKRTASPWGADHSSEVAYVFDRLGAVLDRVTPRDQSVATRLADYWANFARSGDPNGAGAPEWPRYDAETDRVMQVTTSGDFVAAPDPLRARLDFVQRVAEE